MSDGKFPTRIDHKALKGMWSYSSTLALTSAPDEGGWSTPCPGHFNPGKKTRYRFNRSLRGVPECVGRVRKILPPPGFDPWTVQPLASRYTDNCPGPQC